MAINKSEFLTVKKYVTDDILDYCLFDAIAEAVVPAYEELYAANEPVSPVIGDYAEHLKRLDRLSTYATHFLVQKDPEFASKEIDDRLCRDIDWFDRINAWTYSAEYEGDVRIDVIWDCVGTWTAKEYDADGDLSHVGTGKTAQEALNAMRLIVPDDLLDA